MRTWINRAAVFLPLLALGLLAFVLIEPRAPVALQVATVILFALSTLVYGVSSLIAPEAEPSPPPPPRVAPRHLSEEEITYHTLSSRYGIGYQRLQVDCTIRPDGSAEVRRVVKVEAYSEFDRLDTFLLIPESPPDGETRDIDLLQVASRSPDYNVSARGLLRQGGRLYAEIKISPQLSEGAVVEYEMVEHLPPGLYAIDLTPEQLSRRETDFEYFGWNINRPTRRLTLRAYFPERTKPTVYGLEVRYAPAAPGLFKRTTQREEQARLARPTLEGPVGGRYVLKLDVEYPMIGLIYILRWEPLETTSRPAASADAVPVDHDDSD
jgi:hypothetical protein